MIRVLHLSDLHFGDDQLNLALLRREGGLLNKRLLGYMNRRFNKRRQFSAKDRWALLEQCLELEFDYLILTGDLTHLSTSAEFLEARAALEPLLSKAPGRVLLTAGNHDRYVRSAEKEKLLELHFGDCFPFEQETQGPHFLIDPEGWMFVELPMSVATGLHSKGQVQGQIEDYLELFEAYAAHPKVLYGHYPLAHPFGVRESWGHSLWARGQWERLLQAPGVMGYLHGHMHQSWAFQPYSNQEVWSVNAGGSVAEGGYLISLTGGDRPAFCPSRLERRL